MNKIKKTFDSFRILNSWKLVVEKNSKYSGRVFLNITKKIAHVCDWTERDRPKDFEIHEILHIAFAELLSMDRRKQKELIIAEENLIQDICKFQGEAQDMAEGTKYRPTNRERAMTARKVKFWCNGCDRALVGEYGKCPVCGHVEEPKKRRIPPAD